MSLLMLVWSRIPPWWVVSLYVLLVWSLHQIYEVRWQKKARRGVAWATHSSFLERLLPGTLYLLRGPRMVLRNYVPGIAFAVKTPETYYVHVSSMEHMTELRDAPEDCMSLHALSKDLFLPKCTMNGLEVRDEMKGNERVHIQALRVLLKSHLPQLSKPLAKIIAQAFDHEYNGKSAVHIKDGWVKLPLFQMTKRVVTVANAFIFFGPELAGNESFVQAALAYPEDLFFTAETLRLVPSIFHAYLGPRLMRNHQATKLLVKHLLPIVEARLSGLEGGKDPRNSTPRDCIQFFIEASHRSRRETWTAMKVVQVLLGVWFAAVHQPALTAAYILEDVCRNQEFIDPIKMELTLLSDGDRQSVDAALNGSDSIKITTAAVNESPLLDAFLKESARLHPSDSISIRRKVLKPFTFRDGTHILPDDVACVPMQAIMLDGSHYAKPNLFSPWRFLNVNNESGDNPNASPVQSQNLGRFSDPCLEFPLWGLGLHACPGRYYASLLLKLFTVHLITSYDLALPQQTGSRTFSFRSSIVPRSDSCMLFRKNKNAPEFF